ncbi:MAG: hypothetical protein R3C53_13355 [Pirellulaceae bacterium]
MSSANIPRRRLLARPGAPINHLQNEIIALRAALMEVKRERYVEPDEGASQPDEYDLATAGAAEATVPSISVGPMPAMGFSDNHI